MHNENQSLIFEVSKEGRVGYNLEPLDVPDFDLAELLPSGYVREEAAEEEAGDCGRDVAGIRPGLAVIGALVDATVLADQRDLPCPGGRQRQRGRIATPE